MNKASSVVIVLIVISIGLGYVMYSSGLDKPGMEESSTIAIVDPQRVTVGDRAPDFKATDIYGNQVSLSSLKGKPIIIWFMASWCPSCIYMANTISRATRGYDVVVLVVDMWSREFMENVGILGKPGYPPPDTREKLRIFLENYGEKGWIPILDNGELVKLYGVRYIDTVYVINEDGIVVFGGGNIATVDSLREAIGE